MARVLTSLAKRLYEVIDTNLYSASPAGVPPMFKTFPEFSKLTLNDREEYESYIKDFPPISDILFASIMVWWGALDGLAVSKLNDNLVISYWIPGDENTQDFLSLGISV